MTLSKRMIKGKIMNKQEINAKLKDLGNNNLRLNGQIYRTRLNKMIKGIGLYCVGPYTINEMQVERFKELVEKVRAEFKGYTADNLPGYARIEVQDREIVMTLQSFQKGEYTHYYAAFSVK